ncbi:MAG: hypothetical protein ATN32_06995 [Candidatus Epulonipiscium fishelsonii]|nr:MAG: hypothetical protein ATN32_06995 [Epulopiscium sp. AS2M-Bin002]
MNKDGLLAKTITSAIGSVLTRLIGMALTVYISNQIGAEGVGLYQLAMTIYMMAYMVASAGIITSISKLLAEELSRGYIFRARRIMNIFFIMGFTASITITGLVYGYADFLSELIIKDTRIVAGLKVLSLSIPFMTLSACFKGYFYALKDIMKPASAEVFEQVVKFTLMVGLLAKYGNSELSIACTAMSLSITLGEIISFGYLFVLYFTNRQKGGNKREEDEGSLIPKITSVLMPITASSYLTAVFVLLENTLIPMGLQKYGMSSSESVSLYGMVKGMVLPLVLFPTALLSACSTVMTPEIARATTLKYKGRVESLSSRIIHMTLLVAFFVMCILVVYGQHLAVAVYGDVEVGRLLQITVLMSPFVYLEIVIDGILKGMGEQKKTLEYRIIDAILRILMMYFLIPDVGILGLIATIIITNVISAILHLNRLMKLTGITIDITRWIVEPLVVSMAGALLTKTFIMDIFLTSFNLNVQLSLSMIAATIFYIIVMSMLDDNVRNIGYAQKN